MKNNWNNITMIGMPASGKSTVGVLLAKRIGYKFIDSDLLIQEQEERLLKEIIAEDGLEGFLAIDGILDLYLNVVDGLVVYPKVIRKHLMAELPFMATENIMMDAVKAGGDRQELHEKIRQLSMQAGKTVKEEGKDNNLLELIAADPSFHLSLEDLEASMQPERYVGRAPKQTEEFITEVINPILEKNKEVLGLTAEINV